jgi:hypothetical protein
MMPPSYILPLRSGSVVVRIGIRSDPHTKTVAMVRTCSIIVAGYGEGRHCHMGLALLAALLCAAVAALPRLEHPPKTDGSLSLLVVGDDHLVSRTR